MQRPARYCNSPEWRPAHVPRLSFSEARRRLVPGAYCLFPAPAACSRRPTTWPDDMARLQAACSRLHVRRALAHARGAGRDASHAPAGSLAALVLLHGGAGARGSAALGWAITAESSCSRIRWAMPWSTGNLSRSTASPTRHSCSRNRRAARDIHHASLATAGLWRQRVMDVL